MNNLVDWGAKTARYMTAAPMALYGVQHFIYLQFVADYIPAWIPWHSFWAVFTGMALIAAAAGLVLRVLDEWAATLLGLMILLWVVLLHTSRIAAQPTSAEEWRGVFQALAMSGFAFVLAGSISTQRVDSGRSSIRALALLGAKVAPWFIGVAVFALGVEHLIWAEGIGAKVPLWIPGSAWVNHLAGIALMAVGAGMLIRTTAAISSTVFGLMVLGSMVLVHLPIVLTSPRFESDWCKTLVMSGGAFLLARSSKAAFGRGRVSSEPADARTAAA